VLNIDMVSVGSGNNHAKVHTFQKYMLVGDFDVQVDFELLSFPTSEYPWASLQLINYWIDDVNRPSEEARALVKYDGGRYYGGEVRHNGIPALLDGSGSYAATSDNSGKFRVTRVGNTAYTYYWNGSSWTLLESGTIGSNNMAIGLWVYSNGAEPSVNFDNLVVNSADAVLHAI